jgi:hypothetical protein
VTLDITLPEDKAGATKARQRLVQAGVVPTTLKQVIQEWAAHTLDLQQRKALLNLLHH